MPTLVQKSDGAYIVQHYYQEYCTWQVGGDGVRFLRERGVGDGDRFPTDLFMELWMRGMVWTGDRPPPQPDRRPEPLSADGRDLLERAMGLYTALYQQRADDAYTFLPPSIRAIKTLEQFGAEVVGTRGFRLASWKILDVSSFPLQGEADRGGQITVDIEIEDNSGARHQLYGLREYWLQIQNEWYCIWSGWKL